MDFPLVSVSGISLSVALFLCSQPEPGRRDGPRPRLACLGCREPGCSVSPRPAPGAAALCRPGRKSDGANEGAVRGGRHGKADVGWRSAICNRIPTKQRKTTGKRLDLRYFCRVQERCHSAAALQQRDRANGNGMARDAQCTRHPDAGAGRGGAGQHTRTGLSDSHTLATSLPAAAAPFAANACMARSTRCETPCPALPAADSESARETGESAGGGKQWQAVASSGKLLAGATPFPPVRCALAAPWPRPVRRPGRRRGPAGRAGRLGWGRGASPAGNSE